MRGSFSCHPDIIPILFLQAQKNKLAGREVRWVYCLDVMPRACGSELEKNHFIAFAACKSISEWRSYSKILLQANHPDTGPQPSSCWALLSCLLWQLDFSFQSRFGLQLGRSALYCTLSGSWSEGSFWPALTALGAWQCQQSDAQQPSLQLPY